MRTSICWKYPWQANRVLNTLKGKCRKERDLLTDRIARCEAASHLNDGKKLASMKHSHLSASLILLADDRDKFGLDLQIRITLRLCSEMLGSISKTTSTTEAVEKIRRWTMLVTPWQECQTTVIAEDGEEAEVAVKSMDPKNPSFYPIFQSIMELGGEDEGGATRGDEDADEDWMQKLLEGKARSAAFQVLVPSC